MNNHTFRTTVAAATLLLMAGCGTAVSDQAKAPRQTQAQAQVDAGATYDGWQARLRRDSAPPACAYSPDLVQRMLEAGRPVPRCVQRQERWFRDFDVTGARNGRTGRK
ncbi:hypothetical protein [Nocardioides sp. GXQ0305]|uniref:hypothetical protein n=1 Tax=Nocardioides sp. GXQ0305 TaxID=3423912 RepID=UPI003D7EE0CD